MARIVDVQGVVVEGRQGADHAAHDGHRVGVAAEAVEEALQLLVNHGVVLDGVDELFLLRGVGQFALQQQVAGFQVVGLLGELFDGIAAVQQHALVAIDIGDLRLARGGRHKARIKGVAAGGGQATYIDYIGPHGAGEDGQFDGGCALDDQLRFFVSHDGLLFMLEIICTTPHAGPAPL
ncbi:hypothetical protein D9M71_331400 [compost metagenome]